MSVIETLFAMTIFKSEIDSLFLAQFALLISIKMLHWLAQDRVEYVSVDVPKCD